MPVEVVLDGHILSGAVDVEVWNGGEPVRRVLDGFDADGSTSTALVDHYDGLPKDRRYFVAEEPREDVGDRARRKGINNLNRFCGVLGSMGYGDKEHEEEKQQAY